MKTSPYRLAGLLLAFAPGCFAEASPKASAARTENKNITWVTAQSQADGGTEIHRETLRECILSLPRAADLVPEVKAKSVFLREVNGDPKRNERVRVYEAKVTVNYLLHQKDLLVVGTRSVQGQEPVLKELDKRVRQSRDFQSEESEGDLYAGMSDRRYYFTKSEEAARDAKSRAEAWIRQQTPVLCSEGPVK